MNITFGPILNLRNVSADVWQVSAFILIERNERVGELQLAISSGVISGMEVIAQVPYHSPKYHAVRFNMLIPLSSLPQTIDYQIEGGSYRFCVPAKNAMPNIAYVSCNGFSDPKLMKDVEDKNNRWRDINKEHGKVSFHVLMMGGDQIYSDSIWSNSELLKQWSNRWGDARWRAPFTDEIRHQTDDLFFNIYFSSFRQDDVCLALSTIPTIMMWDDHDIIDGWGSYPQERHESPMYQGIFEVAESYFRLFQLQLATPGNECHPATITGVTNYCLGFTFSNSMSILVADLRKERKPVPMQIMSLANWDAFYTRVDAIPADGHLIIQSSIPVAYLNLNKIESLLSVLPGQQELEDDLRDHWRSEAHVGERKRFVNRLLDYTRRSRTRVTIVSGDVHVAASAIIESTRYPGGGFETKINQLISTGVVHPAPGAIVRYLLESNASEIETIDSGITAKMLPLASKGHYLIGSRNWLSLEPDDQRRLWAKWHVETNDEVISKAIHPADYR